MKKSYSNCYDYYFQDYGVEIFGGRVDWRWFKAMAIAESALNPEELSRVGAIGVMQVMAGTGMEVAEKLGIESNLLCPHINIRLGIAYARQCWDIWKEEHGLERIRFMIGSYNAGPGSILKAQELVASWKMPTDEWKFIISALPEVTGGYSGQTIRHVGKVEKICQQLMEEN